MTIPVDNGIIDFNTLQGIYTQLADHEDLAQTLQNNSLVTIVNGQGTTTSSTSSLNVSSFQISATSWNLPAGTPTLVPFGVPFSAPPVVTATAQAQDSGGPWIAQVVSLNQDQSSSYYTGVNIVVRSSSNTKATTNVAVNLIAIGQK